MIGNCVFFHAAGDWRYADVGELIFGPTHCGRMLAEEDQGVKRAAICMQEIDAWQIGWEVDGEENRRLEFQLCAGFVGPRGSVLVASTARAMGHGLSPFAPANVNPRRKPRDWQR